MVTIVNRRQIPLRLAPVTSLTVASEVYPCHHAAVFRLHHLHMLPSNSNY